MRACPVGCPGGRACTRAGSQGGKLLFSTEGGRSGRARQAGRQALCAPAWTAAPIRAVRARGGRAGVPRRRPRGASRSAGAWGTRWPLAHGRLCWFRLLVATGSRLVVGRIGDGLAGKGVHRTTTDGEGAARSPAVRGPARGGGYAGELQLRGYWRDPTTCGPCGGGGPDKAVARLAQSLWNADEAAGRLARWRGVFTLVTKEHRPAAAGERARQVFCCTPVASCSCNFCFFTSMLWKEMIKIIIVRSV